MANVAITDVEFRDLLDAMRSSFVYQFNNAVGANPPRDLEDEFARIFENFLDDNTDQNESEV